MSANIYPIFALTPLTPFVNVTGSTTDRTGATTGSLGTLVTAGTNGAKITAIGMKAASSSAAMQGLVFITDTAGLNPRLYDEISLAPATPSTTLASARAVTTYADLQLGAGQQILVGITVATTGSGINFFASQGDF